MIELLSYISNNWLEITVGSVFFCFVGRVCYEILKGELNE